jgi:hypothetical protein
MLGAQDVGTELNKKECPMAYTGVVVPGRKFDSDSAWPDKWHAFCAERLPAFAQRWVFPTQGAAVRAHTAMFRDLGLGIANEAVAVIACLLDHHNTVCVGGQNVSAKFANGSVSVGVEPIKPDELILSPVGTLNILAVSNSFTVVVPR